MSLPGETNVTFLLLKDDFLTIHTRVVIINGFDNTAEVQLDVLLNKPRIKGTEMAVLVIHTENIQKLISFT